MAGDLYPNNKWTATQILLSFHCFVSRIELRCLCCSWIISWVILFDLGSEKQVNYNLNSESIFMLILDKNYTVYKKYNNFKMELYLFVFTLKVTVKG